VPPGRQDRASLSIGQLADATGVTPRTIRYYEEVGILPVPERSAGGTRRYPAEYQFYIEGAVALKEIGFSLDEVVLIGRLAYGTELTDEERDAAHRLIADYLAALEHKIKVLNRLRTVLVKADGRAVGGQRIVTALVPRAGS
jgi:DNA-binding transcriptional MerR regulator